MNPATTEDRTSVGLPPPAPPGGRRQRRWLLVALAAVAVVAAATVALRPDGGTPVQPGASSSTTVATTAPSTTTAPEVVGDTGVLWPLPGTTIRFDTPAAAARSFATELLGFESPVVGEFRAGDTRSGEVLLRPAARGPVTTVLVRQVGPGDDWSVLGAVSENIEVAEPAPWSEVRSPVRVSGRALAFEGTVQVEVRADGVPGALGAGFVTGGGDVLRPFEGVVAFETSPAPHGTVVLFATSAEDGQVWEATVVRVAFAAVDVDPAACDGDRPARPRPGPGPGQMEVKAYVACDAADGALRPIYRLVPSSPRVLHASLDALLAGPNAAERQASFGSWFSNRTAGMLRSVTIDAGHAVVDLGDLRPVIPNASTSAGSARLLAQLDATVFQFGTVDSVEYRLEGSCEAFGEWLQYGGCLRRTRPTSEG